MASGNNNNNNSTDYNYNYEQYGQEEFFRNIPESTEPIDHYKLNQIPIPYNELSSYSACWGSGHTAPPPPQPDWNYNQGSISTTKPGAGASTSKRSNRAKSGRRSVTSHGQSESESQSQSQSQSQNQSQSQEISPTRRSTRIKVKQDEGKLPTSYINYDSYGSNYY